MAFGGKVFGTTAALKEEIKGQLRKAGRTVKEELKTEFETDMMNMVYKAGKPSVYKRTMNYFMSWKYDYRPTSTGFSVDIRWYNRGSYASWIDEKETVTGMGEIINDAGIFPIPNIPDWAVGTRKHFDETKSKAEGIAKEVIKQVLGI